MRRHAGFLALALVIGMMLASGPGTGQPTGPPHAVYGTVKDSGGTLLEGAKVTVTNLRSGESGVNITDHLGRYSVGLACQTGDMVKVEAVSGNLRGAREVVVGNTSASPLTECNLVLEPEGTSMPVLLGMVGGILAIVVIGVYYFRASRADRQAEARPKRRRSR